MKLSAKITAALTLAAALTLTACESGGETGTTNPPSSVFASKTALPAGDPNCANGGVQIDMGFDRNGNNVLDTGEITSTEYVCNGTDTSSHPFVVYTSPTPNETGVVLDAVISAVFNIEMDADTINDTTFTVKDAAGSTVAGTVTYNGIVAVFQPAQSLVMNTKYTVTLSSVMENDAAGIAMGYDHKVYFTTGDRATVKYMANGADSGTVPVDTGRYATDAIVTVQGNTGNLVRDGYQFVGWSLKQDGAGTKYNASNRLTAGTVNIILYAVWAMPYHVTYDANGGTGSVPVDPAEYTYNQEVTVLGKGDLTNGSLAFAGWNTQADGNGTTYAPGSKFDKGIANVILYAKWSEAVMNQEYSADGITFNMKYVPGGLTFPTGVNDDSTATVADAYWIAETEVTYELWQKVYTWAISGTVGTGAGQYTFANAGRQGGNTGSGPVGTVQHPVTTINWRDSMVWCNALTEWYNAQKGTNYECVYTYSGSIIRDSRDSNAADCDGAVASSTAKGFRLLSSNEYELAARYRGFALWTYGDHASGDNTGACYDDGSILGGKHMSSVFGNYAWYMVNSGLSTHVVGTAGNSSGAACTGNANALGLYDMSGNVREWCFTASGSYRVYRGGCLGDAADGVQVGHWGSTDPVYEDNGTGFRFARSAP